MAEENIVLSLIKELKDAAEMYYQGDGVLLSDDDYDSKLEYLRKLSIEDSTLLENEDVSELLEGSVAGGSKPLTSNVVKHKVPLLSLGKANSLTEIKDWYEKVNEAGASLMKIQAKLDGFAIEARYEKGVGVEISTRGDGYVGEDMSYLFNHKEIKIVGLPSKLSKLSNISLRGELFARHSQFDKINIEREKAVGDRFKNSRNGVVGIVKKGLNGLGYNAELTFCCYSVLIDDEYHDLNDLKVAEKDIVTIDELSEYEWAVNGGEGSLFAKDFNELSDIITKFGEKRILFDIPTDGAVIKPLEEAKLYNKMGLTSHHSKAFIAFKYPSEKVETTVLDIVYSTGKTGRITPKAIVAPVLLDGSTVTRATCHNFDWMLDKDIRIGSKILITKANDIIPAISNVLIVGANEKHKVLTHCPSCGEKLEQKTLKDIKCVNQKCPSIFFFKMNSAVGKQGLDIDGLSNVSLKALCESDKIDDVADLFKLTVDDLKDLPMGETEKGTIRKFGSVRAKKIIKFIENAKENTPAYKLLNAIGFNGIGVSSSKLLLANLGSIEKIVNAQKAELIKIPGLGEVKADKIIDEQKNVRIVFDKLIIHNVVLNNGLKENVNIEGHFAISGKVPSAFANRGVFVDYMAKNGWEFDSSPKNTTDIMFGDSNDTSSKIKKALKLGIKIISPDEYSEVIK